MSSTLSHSDAAAARYNAKSAIRLGWAQRLPEALLDRYPGLATPIASTEFTAAVRLYQERVGLEADGFLGSNTWGEIVRSYLAVESSRPHIIDRGRRLTIQRASVKTWEDPHGLDLHRDGGWAKRKTRPSVIVVHWGGLYPKHCRDVLANRDLSSHFGIGTGGCYQWLDTAHRAFHAGWINNRSIGIDICQQPETKWKAYYEKKGDDLDIIDNRSHPRRGPKKVLELHALTKKHTKNLLLDLCDTFGIPFSCPEDDAAMSRQDARGFEGILGHHHVSRRKWDIAPWLRAIMED